MIHTFLISSRREAGDVTDDKENSLSSFKIVFRALTLSLNKKESQPYITFPKSLVSSKYVVSKSNILKISIKVLQKKRNIKNLIDRPVSQLVIIHSST
jgi:hypothetical protein